MKKILSFLLVFALLFSLTACGKEKKVDKQDDGIDIEYYAKLGQIPEIEYTLGSDIDKLKEDLSKLMEEDVEGEVVYNILEGAENYLIDNGKYSYLYKKANPEKGIGCIVDYDTAYGFELGTVIIEVKEALAEYEYTEEALNDKNAFFMFGVDSGTVIECKFDDNTLAFVFVDNALSATALYTGSDW